MHMTKSFSLGSTGPKTQEQYLPLWQTDTLK